MLTQLSVNRHPDTDLDQPCDECGSPATITTKDHANYTDDYKPTTTGAYCDSCFKTTLTADAEPCPDIYVFNISTLPLGEGYMAQYGRTEYVFEIVDHVAINGLKATPSDELELECHDFEITYDRGATGEIINTKLNLIIHPDTDTNSDSETDA